MNCDEIARTGTKIEGVITFSGKFYNFFTDEPPQKSLFFNEIFDLKVISYSVSIVKRGGGHALLGLLFPGYNNVLTNFFV